MMDSYDAAWICPGHIMVSADPMSTVNDPNPVTCGALKPPLCSHPAKAGSTEHFPVMIPGPIPVAAPHFSDIKKHCVEESEAMCLEQSFQEESHLCIEISAYAEALSPGRKSAESKPSPVPDARDIGRRALSDGVGKVGSTGLPTDFVTWCLHHTVGTIVRANFEVERGIVGGSYDPFAFEVAGIRHIDVPIRDGGVPEREKIQRILDECGDAPRENSEHSAVLFHCKGGFGRSVIYACCLLIHWCDLPGRALLGWVRIMRPGAITTLEQERFLCKLGGRSDLARHLDHQGPNC